jgi:hypothetical protein
VPSIAAIVDRVFLHQTLVYWAKTGSDSYGRPVYADPVELGCRWEDKQQEVILDDGRKVMSKAYILMTTKTVAGSLVFLGDLADVQALPTYPAIPTVDQGTREELLVKETPDIKARSYIYEVYL